MTAASRQVVGDLTRKQADFVEELLSGAEPTSAYLAAYTPPTMSRRTAGYRARDLMKMEKIKTAMADAREAARERRVVTIETVTDLLFEAVAVARERQQAAPMTAAAVALAKLHGLLGDGGAATMLETRSPAELLTQLRLAAGDLGISLDVADRPAPWLRQIT